MAHGFKEIRQQGNSSPNVKGCCERKKAALVSKSSDRGGAKGGVGSRRMFSTAFKLQVLDSYRADADCRGNQRATARKYGIHRRQIQKWLQMESNLRCSAMATENGNAAVGNGSGEAVALNLAAAQARQRDGTCAAGCLSVVKESKTRLEPVPKADVQASYMMATPPATDDDDDEELNVDGISDSEDDMSSGGESILEQDQALDFTCAALSRRRFYSLEFKLSVLDVFHNECFRNQRATALKFGIHRRQVQKWLNQEALLRSEYASTTKSSIAMREPTMPIICEPSPTLAIREPSSPCLDLTRKRKLDDDVGEVALKKSYIDLDAKRPLCLVKSFDVPYAPSTPSCTPPYTSDVVVLPYSTSPTSPYWPPTSCCGDLSPPQFYDCWTSAGAGASPYVCPYACITSRLHQDAVYYKQAVKDINLYAPTALYS
ncbi:Brinker DNA-Hypothetical protein domain [Nesidiocoris tenuis]|uniref:Brinker DNA-binding domain-containing protein n=1 Tax=Nesidiocoris tenuis TaxID=355587 RepID=A0ABN7ANE2_9HEMI|nr:Brinker DNA-Hypothetical protein domain [Nesidiocoris tenuis]